MTGHPTNVHTQFEKSSTMMKVGKMEKRDYQYKEFQKWERTEEPFIFLYKVHTCQHELANYLPFMLLDTVKRNTYNPLYELNNSQEDKKRQQSPEIFKDE